MPWPDLDNTGAISLLQTLRTAATPGSAQPPIRLVLPVPGDVRGLPAGTQFQRDALDAGEAIIVARNPSGSLGLVPDFEYDDSDDESAAEPELNALSWTVYSAPAAPPAEHPDLGDAEYTLRSAVRSAADALGTLRAGITGDIADPRGLVEQILDSGRDHRAPDHAPSRALRVLESAAHVDAIITVSSGLLPISLQTPSEAITANDALRPLAAVVRSARMAAVAAILDSAWRGSAD